ncbi:hypothetical protein [Blautia sp.]|uniref:hypothetical protein n=1 Tax=Blautia sp. TaxID=1955243 RepID=UPI003AB24EB4
MKNHKNPIRHNQIPHHNTENYKKWQADFLEKVLAAIFLGNSNQLGKNPRRRQALPFPAGFPQRMFKDPPQFQKLNRRDVSL